MLTSLQKLMEYALNHPRQLFLIDGLGALITAFSLGVVLRQFESVFGMPTATLVLLSGVAFLFAIYSLSSYCRLPKNWPQFLSIIAFANLLYCCTTLVLLFIHKNSLTLWGYSYFIFEIIIIVSLVIIELSTAAKQNALRP